MKKTTKITLLLIAVAPWATLAQGLYPAPEKKSIEFHEFRQSLIDNEGKAVEIEINYVSNIKQRSENEYSASISFYEDGMSSSSLTVYFSKEGYKEFFQDMYKEIQETRADYYYDYDDYPQEDVYLFVQPSSQKVYAVGKRYQKSKKEYSW
jgi:hypothetical protein